MGNDVDSILGRTFPDRHPAYCDHCAGPVVYSERYGWRHKTDRWPHGVPASKDDSGHEVEATKWAAEVEERGAGD